MTIDVPGGDKVLALEAGAPLTTQGMVARAFVRMLRNQISIFVGA